MPKHYVATKREIQFIRALLKHGKAREADGGAFEVVGTSIRRALSNLDCRSLVSAGVIRREGKKLYACTQTRTWLKRQLIAGEDSYSAQHRDMRLKADGAQINLSESPLKKFAASGGKTRFLERYHIEAGERLTRLIARTGIVKRVTMSYGPNVDTGSKGACNACGDLSDMAIDARRELERINATLPRECADILLDVCGFEKGLQLIETERGWPRRSAKLVLRIGLDQLARYFGLIDVATGSRAENARGWRDKQAPTGVIG